MQASTNNERIRGNWTWYASLLYRNKLHLALILSLGEIIKHN